MADPLQSAPLQSPVELKAVLEAERSGVPFVVYRDGPGGLTVTTQRVTSATTLTVTEPTNGGFTARLCPATAGATSCGT